MRDTPQRLALFDFDGTLCAGNTLHCFMRHLLAERRSVPGLLAWSILRKLRLAPSRGFKEGVLGSVRGAAEEELRELGEQVYASRVRPQLLTDGLREIGEVRRQGYRVVLVTGAFDFLVRPFCREFGVLEVLCCRVAMTDEGRCAGRIDGLEMRGMDKVAAIKSLFPQASVDWPASRAYTDEAGDEPMLALVGERFQVAGDAPAIAGTKILEWHQTLGN